MVQPNGISKANYYYRLRRVREAYIETTTQSSETTFVELPVMSDLQTPKKQVSTDQPIAQIHTSVDLSIDIFSSISAEQSQSLIGAVKMLMMLMDLKRSILPQVIQI